MLLRRPVLDRIVAGEVDLVFRRWKRPTVKTGGTMRTPAGMLEIVEVRQVGAGTITEDQARRAGLDLADLLTFLNAKTEGDVYMVRLGSVRPDPRVALREDADLSTEDIVALTARLDRLDRVSKRGPWTREFLRLIYDNPDVRAQDLADRLDLDKTVFKNDVRKLKALGLTISHSPGYEVSPRGRAYLTMTGG